MPKRFIIKIKINTIVKIKRTFSIINIKITWRKGAVVQCAMICKHQHQCQHHKHWHQGWAGRSFFREWKSAGRGGVGRGEGENPRGGAKKRVNRLIQKIDKSASIALSVGILSALSILPAPIIFGALYDSSCTIWGEKCGETLNCLVYDTDKLRTGLAHLVASLISVALMRARSDYSTISKKLMCWWTTQVC